jgi:uncharacterized delta-60 repeat protein
LTSETPTPNGGIDVAPASRGWQRLHQVLLGACLAALVALAAAAPSALARAGDLDPSFGNGGRVTIPANAQAPFERTQEHSVSTAIANLPAGGTVVLTTRIGYGATLYGFEADGSISSRFGAVRVTHGGDERSVSDLAVDSLGRVLVAGSSTATSGAGQSSESAFVVRYTPDGRPDPSFGEEGVVVTDFGLPGPRVAAGESAPASRVRAFGIAVDHNDRVIIAGTRLSAIGPCRGTIGLPYAEAFVARLDSDGRRDTSFGRAGVVSLMEGPELGDDIQDLNAPVVDANGRIYLSTRPTGPCDEGEAALVGRLDASGRADPSFGDGGWVRVAGGAPGSFLPFSITLDSRNRLLLLASGAQGAAIVKRVLPRGAVDRTFGRRGVATVRGPSGRFLVAGQAIDGSGRVLISGTFGRSFFLGRLTSGGQVDHSFGRSGRVITGFGSHTAVAAGGVVTDASGRAVVTGPLRRPRAPRKPGLALARYLGGR